jgi:aminopeptidase N
LEEVSGRSLGRFFEQWLYKPGHPELDVTLSWEKDVLLVAVRQTHGATDGVPAHFDVPIDLDIRTPKGETRRERLMLRQKSETFALRCSERPLFVVVDPDMRILGEVAVKAPLDMLRSQLQKASTARGRWLAAMALGQSDDPMSLAVLEKALSDEEEFWGVRSECAEALGKIRSKEAFEVLARHARTSHPKVRRSVVGALGAFRTQAAVEALRPIALRDASYLVEAEAARALGKTRREGAFETLVDLLDRPSWADVLRAGVADGLAALRDERALPHLLARTRYGHSERARRAAIMALPKLTSDRRTRETIEELLEDTNAHVRLDAARALGDMGDARSRSALRVRIERELDPRVRRRMREVLRDLGADSRQSFKDLKDEFEKVTAEFSELKSRVGKLEARMDPKAAGGTVPTPAASSAEVASTARGTTGASSAAAKPTPRRRGVDKAIRHERETKVSRKPRRR